MPQYLLIYYHVPLLSPVRATTPNVNASSVSCPDHLQHEEHSQQHRLQDTAIGRRLRRAKSTLRCGADIRLYYADEDRLYVTFIDKDGEETKIAVSKGDNLLDVAQANDIEMEGMS